VEGGTWYIWEKSAYRILLVKSEEWRPLGRYRSKMIIKEIE